MNTIRPTIVVNEHRTSCDHADCDGTRPMGVWDAFCFGHDYEHEFSSVHLASGDRDVCRRAGIEHRREHRDAELSSYVVG